jgi:hypothetical protein
LGGLGGAGTHEPLRGVRGPLVFFRRAAAGRGGVRGGPASRCLTTVAPVRVPRLPFSSFLPRFPFPDSPFPPPFFPIHPFFPPLLPPSSSLLSAASASLLARARNVCCAGLFLFFSGEAGGVTSGRVPPRLYPPRMPSLFCFLTSAASLSKGGPLPRTGGSAPGTTSLNRSTQPAPPTVCAHLTLTHYVLRLLNGGKPATPLLRTYELHLLCSPPCSTGAPHGSAHSSGGCPGEAILYLL